MKIAHARHRLQLEQPQQLPDLLMGVEGDLTLLRPGFSPAFFLRLIEINQQRLIAGKLKPRALTCCPLHARESIPQALIPEPGALATLLPSCFLRPETSLRSRAAWSPQPHSAAHSAPEVSRGSINPRPVPTTTAPPAKPSRRTASRRGRLASARQRRTHPPLRVH